MSDFERAYKVAFSPKNNHPPTISKFFGGKLALDPCGLANEGDGGPSPGVFIR